MNNDDKQLIVDCLLFSASSQVCSNWDIEKHARMVELAKTIDAQPSEDIEFWADEYELEEPWANQIPEEFEIKLTGVEEDRAYTPEERAKEQEEKAKEQEEGD